MAHIHEAKCIGCELCYIACWDGAHQCIHLDRMLGRATHVECMRIRVEAEAAAASDTVTPIPKLDLTGPATWTICDAAGADSAGG